MKAQRELEVVLVVASSDPESTIEKVSLLRSLKSYRLTNSATRLIHDVYFDTAEGLLARKKMNLRIREEDGRFWITWKRGLGLFSWRNRDERREVELSWSQESFSRILDELSGKGLRLGPPVYSGRPVDDVKSVGLLVVQDRETTRRASSVSSKENGTVLAELTIDSVVYHFATGNVELFELEVELKTGEGRVLEDVRAGLLESFVGELRPWRWGKLVTGKMIERMLRKGVLQPFLEGNRLGPRAFEALEKALVSGVI